MKFESSTWFVFLPLVAAVVVAAFLELKGRKKKFSKAFNPKLWSKIVPELSWNAKERKLILICIALVFVVLALARPQGMPEERTVTLRGVDAMIVLDLSRSMDTEDMVPSRVNKAKHFLKSFLEGLGQDRVGLIGFAASTLFLSPLTTDLKYLEGLLDNLSTDTLKSQGTDIGLALDTAVKALERGAESAATGSRVIILVSDGEDFEEKASVAAREVKNKGISFYVLGVGTERGGPVPIRDSDGVLSGHKKDESGEVVISKFNPKFLNGLAKTGGGEFIQISNHEGEVDILIREVSGLKGEGGKSRKFVVYSEWYQFPLLIAILLLFIELTLPARKTVVILLMLTLGLSSELRAEGLEPYLKNKEGVEAFENKDLDTAKQKFSEAQALEPESPTLMFNQGVVQFQAEDRKTSSRSFGIAAEKFKAKGDERRAGRAYFNEGSSRAAEQDVTGAVHSYLNALESARKSSDEALEKETLKKLLAMKSQAQQGKQNQKQDDDKNDDKNKDKKDGDQQKESQDEKNQNQPQKYQQSKKQEFRSKKLSREDVERVMSKLREQQKDIQDKFKKGKQGEASGGKDW